MKLGITGLALLAFASNVSAADIVPFSNINLNTSQNTVKAKPTYKDCSKMLTKTSEDGFLRLIMDTSIDSKTATSKAALYALEKHSLFNGNQLYLFSRMLLTVNEAYAANVLLERIVERDTSNSSPDLLIKVADNLKQNNPILAGKAYSYAQQHPQATADEKALAESEYNKLKNLVFILNSL
jgi:hypothetical protein